MNPASHAYPGAVDEPEAEHKDARGVAQAKTQTNDFETNAHAKREPDDKNVVPATAKR